MKTIYTQLNTTNSIVYDAGISTHLSDCSTPLKKHKNFEIRNYKILVVTTNAPKFYAPTIFILADLLATPPMFCLQYVFGQ